jgi:hypothetical protein
MKSNVGYLGLALGIEGTEGGQYISITDAASLLDKTR